MLFPFCDQMLPLSPSIELESVLVSFIGIIEFNISAASDKHGGQSSVKDCKLMLKELLEQKVFDEISGRNHFAFKDMDSNMTGPIDKKL